MSLVEIGLYKQHFTIRPLGKKRLLDLIKLFTEDEKEIEYYTSFNFSCAYDAKCFLIKKELEKHEMRNTRIERMIFSKDSELSYLGLSILENFKNKKV